MQEQKLTSLSVPVLLDGQLWQPVIGSGLVQIIRSLSAQQGCWEAERPGIVKTQLRFFGHMLLELSPAPYCA